MQPGMDATRSVVAAVMRMSHHWFRFPVVMLGGPMLSFCSPGRSALSSSAARLVKNVLTYRKHFGYRPKQGAIVA
jgi:hypothetical protein